MRIKVAAFLVICVCLIFIVFRYTHDRHVARQVAEKLFENPEPLPTYIDGFHFGNRTLCPDVKLGFFEGTDDLPSGGIGLDELIDKVEYRLNGRRVTVTGLDNGRYHFYSCIVVDYLPEGLHYATIQLIRFSGDIVMYSWAFQVDGPIRGLDFDELAAKITLPEFP